MSAGSGSAASDRSELVALYDEALPYVYGYLVTRCGSVTVAEDLTSETFLAAADAVRGPASPPLSRAWLIGVARHKLADHWRRAARERARLTALEPLTDAAADPWDEVLDRDAAWRTLSGLAPHHRCALTLRYVDDLPVPAVAAVLGRSLHATEGLLVRARTAFRRAYTEPADPADRPAQPAQPRKGGDHA
ncbi:MAG: RNA polymerase sigma factor [Actinomycetota bacterium]|nr:RNA polymerase sigma factor [Actinomycetota bacterium]